MAPLALGAAQQTTDDSSGQCHTGHGHGHLLFAMSADAEGCASTGVSPNGTAELGPSSESAVSGDGGAERCSPLDRRLESPITGAFLLQAGIAELQRVLEQEDGEGALQSKRSWAGGSNGGLTALPLHSCDQCDKTFSKQSSLARHKYEHSGFIIFSLIFWWP